jgi:hypothetical protein
MKGLKFFICIGMVLKKIKTMISEYFYFYHNFVLLFVKLIKVMSQNMIESDSMKERRLKI